MVSILDSMSSVEFACPVDRDPSCPVFIALSISSASAPRTSPTMIRSGLARRLVLIRSRIVTAPLPSIPPLRASSVTTLSSADSRNSAASSMVIILSPSGIRLPSTFSNVVLPAPVPPHTNRLYRFRTSFRKNMAASSVRVPHRIISCKVIGWLRNFRMVNIGPFRAIGGKITLILDPSASLASAIGTSSFTRRLTCPTIC